MYSNKIYDSFIPIKYVNKDLQAGSIKFKIRYMMSNRHYTSYMLLN